MSEPYWRCADCTSLLASESEAMRHDCGVPVPEPVLAPAPTDYGKLLGDLVDAVREQTVVLEKILEMWMTN